MQNIDDWIILYGILFTEKMSANHLLKTNRILRCILPKIGLRFHHSRELYYSLRGTLYFPLGFKKLDQRQTKLLISNMLIDGFYVTNSNQRANEFCDLCLRAGMTYKTVKILDEWHIKPT